MKKRVAVIGAGPMGLACAYELLKSGHDVDIFEADDRVGGMTAHFDFNGLSIERYYHFICKHDQPMFDILEELGISGKLKWNQTRMGYFFDGKLYDWGNPWALLKFTPLSFIERLRYGVHMFTCTKMKSGDSIDKLEATAWIKKWIGDKAYDILWKKLFLLKFHKFTGNLSASWIWARIRRVGQSRKNIFQEEMGYLEGGSVTILDAFEKAIKTLGGNIRLSTPVNQVLINSDKVVGIESNKKIHEFDEIVCTVPLPFVPSIIPELSSTTTESYKNVQNIGVVCVLLKLKKPVTNNFWLNINDERMDVPGLIEISNLRPFDEHIAYIPFYLPRDNAKFKNSDDMFSQEARQIVLKINSEMSEDDIIDIHVSRYGYAQPICPPGFKDSLPPIKSEIKGLYIADTSYYYPEDRSISESVDLGKRLASYI